MLRQALVYLKNQYNTNLFSFARLVAVVFVVAFAAGMLMDAFLPFTGLWNVARSLVLFPLAGSIYAGGYLIGYYLHQRREREDPTWTPLRLRFSLVQRRRIAIVVAAVLLVFVYGTMMAPGMGYTISAALTVACIITLLAFLRATPDEAMREDLGIPDARDVHYNLAMRERAKAREAEALEKAEAKKRRREGQE